MKQVYASMGTECAYMPNIYFQDSTFVSSNSCNMQNQATIYARLAESPSIKNELSAISPEVEKIDNKLQLTVLPISAENAGLLPNRGGMILFVFLAFLIKIFSWVGQSQLFTRYFFLYSLWSLVMWCCFWIPIYVCHTWKCKGTKIFSFFLPVTHPVVFSDMIS